MQEIVGKITGLVSDQFGPHSFPFFACSNRASINASKGREARNPYWRSCFMVSGKSMDPRRESLQQNGQRTGYCDMPRFGLLSASSLVDQKNVSPNFESKTDRFPFARPKLHRKACV
jgi:hypothetical protein